MIRQRLHERWTKDLSPDERLLRSVFNVNVEAWFHDVIAKVVDIWPEGEPKYITAMLKPCFWLSDWQLTLGMRKPVPDRNADRVRQESVLDRFKDIMGR